MFDGEMNVRVDGIGVVVEIVDEISTEEQCVIYMLEPRRWWSLCTLKGQYLKVLHGYTSAITGNTGYWSPCVPGGQHRPPVLNQSHQDVPGGNLQIDIKFRR